MTENETITNAFEDFDRLPDSALITASTLDALFGHQSQPVRWRRIKDGVIPQPLRMETGSRPLWRVGEVREAMSRMVRSNAEDFDRQKRKTAAAHAARSAAAAAARAAAE